MKKWYAVYTRPGCEKKVADALSKRRWQAYLPMTLPKKGVAELVFPNLVFVNIPESGHQQIKEVPGVLNLFYWLQKPAVIRDIEIEMLRRFLSEHKTVRVERTAVSNSEIVRLVIDSPMEEGVLAEREKANTKLVIPSLGYSLVAREEKVDVGLRRASFTTPVEFRGNLSLG